jgi:hypothetical protein
LERARNSDELNTPDPSAMNTSPGKNRILLIETIGFSTIIVLAWFTEVIRIPHVLFDEPFEPNWHRAILRTVVVILVWVWVRAETKRLLQRLHRLEEFLVVCAWCRRIGDDGQWVTMEKYFGHNFDTRTSHSLCPDCSTKMLAGLDPKSPPGSPPAPTRTP